jgi:hypothetical protein
LLDTQEVGGSTPPEPTTYSFPTRGVPIAESGAGARCC